MKKIILTILTTITILGINAQGNNLQFNRALFETVFSEIPDNLSPNYTLQNAFTVPSNKTWKITKWNSSNRSSINTESGYIGRFYISKSGQNDFIYISTNINNSKTQEIIWFPEGTYDISIGDITGLTSIEHNIIFTGIEFNIVQ